MDEKKNMEALEGYIRIEIYVAQAAFGGSEWKRCTIHHTISGFGGNECAYIYLNNAK